ncbi:polysaccharide biosynthesis tyrosine autokinase [Propionicimonas sp.]|uniref:polysaccharide biosynthesis tyrosine autokinase n=1 Tax=Propionicimonas sp. TaxID=1955623 RepID=UPI0039E37083
MELHSYLAGLRKHSIAIIVMVVLGAGLSLLLFWRTPATYAAQVQFYVSTPLPEGSNAQAAGQFAQARVNSYVVLLSSEELASRVIRATGVDLDATEVADRITARANSDTVLVTATVSDQIPERSLQIATGIGTEFPTMVDELDNAGRDSSVVVIHIVSGPTLLADQVSPSLRLYLLTGLAAGLVLGVGYAMLRQVLDTSIHTPAQASDATGVPVLASLPLDPEVQKAPLIIGAQSMSHRAEAHRKLRTNLQFVDAAQNASSILITSSVPNEGKSLTAVNLALSLVETGEKVVLVDADMRKPRLSRYLDLASEVGLSNLLAGQAELDQVIQPWGEQGLACIASGSVPPNPAELLGSKRMSDLIQELKGRFDRIVIDAPPILPVADAIVVSREVDGVVVVVRAHKTPRNEVSHAAASLTTVGATVVGAVLNMRKVSRFDREYGSNYRYSVKSNGFLGRIRRRSAEEIGVIE